MKLQLTQQCLRWTRAANPAVAESWRRSLLQMVALQGAPTLQSVEFHKLAQFDSYIDSLVVKCMSFLEACI